MPKIKIELLDYWHVGCGKGRGAHLDAVVDRDSSDLPYVPGKMLKGLLRNAALCLVEWGHHCNSDLEGIFGKEGGTEGSLRISDARLEGDVADYLACDGQAHLRQQLFDEHFSTAIEHETGNAKEKSLRGIELAIPCTLYADLELPVNGACLVSAALPLIRSLGAHRSRGLGRCQMTLIEE